jgi:hypothetical protein
MNVSIILRHVGIITASEEFADGDKFGPTGDKLDFIGLCLKYVQQVTVLFARAARYRSWAVMS